MALPSGIRYGQVTWAAVSAVADGADPDGLPDAVPVSGSVTFTPSATVLLATGSSPVTVIATPVTYDLDGAGVLRDAEGRSAITLVATDSPGITPTGWTWVASYRLNGNLSRGSFPFALPSGATIDLTNASPVAASGGTAIVQGPAGPAGGPFSTEDMRDLIGSTLVAGTNVAITVDDAANTVTIASTASGGGTVTATVNQVVFAGTNANTARPTVPAGTGLLWLCSTQPANLDGSLDYWIQANIGGPGAVGGGGSSTNAVLSVNGQTGTVVLNAGDVGALPSTYTPRFADLPSGVTLTVIKGSSGWPPRPTARTDLVVAWKGSDPSPPIISSGTGGMLNNVDYRLVT